jgi:hypothetical protein
MTPVSLLTGSSSLLRDSVERVGQRAEAIAQQAATGGDGMSPEFLTAVHELSNAKLTLHATALVAHTLDDLAADLLSRPRR